jgi:DeoR/GlpR family transcriptional regulator of sugar metabolism
MTRILSERLENIIHLVEERDGATVSQIGTALSVSDATVRRDLNRLAQRGLLLRCHGGATPLQHVPVGPPIAESRTRNPAAKESIGREAAKLIHDGDTIFLDGGSTTHQVACHLSAKGVSVVTNSFDAIQPLLAKEDASVVFLGGELDRVSGATQGATTQGQAMGISVEKAILGADAVSPETGLCSPLSLTAQTKSAMAACARELIVVADHSKLGRSALYRVAPVSALSILVTDTQADAEVVREFAEAGVEVIIAANVEG